MARQHGIASDTYDKLVLDSGAVYTNFVNFGSLGTLLGATRGGATFKRVPSYKETPYEGIPGQVVGQKHLVGVKVTLDVSIIAFDSSNIAKAIPNSARSSVADHVKITEEEWDAAAVHTLTNIAIVAQVSGGTGEPVAIVLDNPISESDFSLNFKDKSEAVSKWVFSAFYKESTGFADPPWRIFWPEES